MIKTKNKLEDKKERIEEDLSWEKRKKMKIERDYKERRGEGV